MVGRKRKFSDRTLGIISHRWLKGETAKSLSEEFGYHPAYHKEVMRQAIQDDKIPMNKDLYEYRVKIGKAIGGYNRWNGNQEFKNDYLDKKIVTHDYVGEKIEYSSELNLGSHNYSPGNYKGQMYAPDEIEKYTREDPGKKYLVGYSS